MKTAPNQRPILVTGAHRTGTTWVGKMLAASLQVAYISEPLNVLHRPGVMGAPVKHWYTYLCTDNQAEYLHALQETLAFDYHAWAEIKSLRSTKDLLRMARDWNIFFQGRSHRQRPLLKDPFAVFSAPWFAERLNCQVVITVRHPAAFASSLKRLDWPFQLGDLLAQPLLMRDWLEPFREEMQALPPEDLLGRGALLWKMVYRVVADYRKRCPEFQIIRHEDLSLDPVEGFRALYASLGLGFTPGIREAILTSSGSENPKELSQKSIHAVKLDSRANLQNWKRRLEPEEIARVRLITEDVASEFYPDLDWD